MEPDADSDKAANDDLLEKWHMAPELHAIT